jgi:hypothetical protein
MLDALNTPPVLVAIIAGLFGLLDLRMRRMVKPIGEHVVNDHKSKNLREQVDRMESKLDMTDADMTKVLRHLSTIDKNVEQLTTWGEVENQRIWAAILREKVTRDDID